VLQDGFDSVFLHPAPSSKQDQQNGLCHTALFISLKYRLAVGINKAVAIRAHPTRVAEVLLSVFYTCCHNRSEILFLVMHFKGGERSFAGLFLPFREPLQKAFRKAPMETFQEGIATVFGLYRGVVTSKPWFTAHGWERTAGSCIIEALSLERT
jgi:hypothetical protein